MTNETEVKNQLPFIFKAYDVRHDHIFNVASIHIEDGKPNEIYYVEEEGITFSTYKPGYGYIRRDECILIIMDDNDNEIYRSCGIAGMSTPKFIEKIRASRQKLMRDVNETDLKQCSKCHTMKNIAKGEVCVRCQTDKVDTDVPVDSTNMDYGWIKGVDPSSLSI